MYIKYIVVSVFLLMLSGFSQAATSIEVQALLGKKVMVLIDGVRRTLTIGKRSPEGVTLISLDRNGAILDVDGKVKKYLMGSPITTNYATPELFEEKIFANVSGMYLRSGLINGRSVKFLIDTGATSVAMNTSQAKRLGIKYSRDGKTITVSTASGFVKAYEVVLKTVSLGSIKQKNVRAVVIEGKHPGPILLGMTFLSTLKVNTAGRVMTLKKRK